MDKEAALQVFDNMLESGVYLRHDFEAVRDWIRDKVDRIAICDSCGGETALESWHGGPDDLLCPGCNVGHVCVECVNTFGHIPDGPHGRGDPEQGIADFHESIESAARLLLRLEFSQNSDTTCPECHGRRYKARGSLARLNGHAPHCDLREWLDANEVESE